MRLMHIVHGEWIPDSEFGGGPADATGEDKHAKGIESGGALAAPPNRSDAPFPITTTVAFENGASFNAASIPCSAGGTLRSLRPLLEPPNEVGAARTISQRLLLSLLLRHNGRRSQ